MFKQVLEVMYFVPDRRQAADWYARLLDTEVTQLENPAHFFVQAGDQELWFLQEDAKGAAGAAGQVAYWRVDCLDAALAKAIELGAVLYRGPLDRQDGFWMCQVKDPFGNLIGLVGARDSVT